MRRKPTETARKGLQGVGEKVEIVDMSHREVEVDFSARDSPTIRDSTVRRRGAGHGLITIAEARSRWYIPLQPVGEAAEGSRREDGEEASGRDAVSAVRRELQRILDEAMVPVATEMENSGEIANLSTTQRTSRVSPKGDGGTIVRIRSYAVATQSAALDKTFRFARGVASIIIVENGATRSETKASTLKATGQIIERAEHLCPAELGELMVPHRHA